jgi:DNA repair protein RadC
VVAAHRPLEPPRERLYRRGVAALADGELIDVLVGVHRRAADRASEPNSQLVAAAGGQLLAAVGGLADLARASPHELARVAGIGRAHAARLAAAFELGRRAVEVAQHRPVIRGPADVLALLGPRVAGVRQELFFAIGLDVRNHVLDIVEIARGSATEVGVHPREVFRPLIRAAAVGAVVAHNHPSGDPTPSLDDIELTRRLCAVGKLVGIPVLDHIVIGGNELRSIIDCIGDP